MKKKKIKKLKKKKKKNPRTTARLYLKRRFAYSILCVDRTLPSRNKKSPIDFHDVRSTLASDKSAKRIFGAKRSLRERNCELRLCRVGCDFRAFFSFLSFFFFSRLPLHPPITSGLRSKSGRIFSPTQGGNLTKLHREQVELL